MQDVLRYLAPEKAAEVSVLLLELGGDSRLVAGGTDLVVQMRAGLLRPRYLVSLCHLKELQSIVWQSSGSLTIGAAVTLQRIIEDPRIRDRYPALIEGALTVGSLQIKARATLAGNICNASPAADTAPALLIYNARINIRGEESRRQLPIEEFFLGPRQTSLQPGEWVESIEVPHPGAHGSTYVKLGRSRGVDLAVVGLGVLVQDESTRLALASVAPRPLRAPKTEAMLGEFPNTEAAWQTLNRTLAEEIQPISDLRASAEYRQAMAAVLLRRGLCLAADRFRQSQGASGERKKKA